MLLALAWGVAASGQEVQDYGPIPTREMFPLFLPPLVYQPVDPTPVGRGRWRVDLDHMRANTFEFSDVFKAQAPRDAAGRLAITRDYVLAHAAEYAAQPLVFFFDEEVLRTTLRARVGLTDRTDLWAELPFQSHTGGALDPFIEAFHSLGFEQYGRDRVARSQLTLVVMTHGTLRFFSDQPIRGKTQDPTVGLVHQVGAGPGWRLSLHAEVKPPLTTTYDQYRSGWDHGGGLTGRWEAAPRHLVYGGIGYIRRPRGNAAYSSVPFGVLRSGWGGHATWEYRRWPTLRPFFQLYAQQGLLPPQVHQRLDRPSLQHDLGVHWQVHPRWLLTLRYLNNLTHNENTADMGFGFSLSTRP